MHGNFLIHANAAPVAVLLGGRSPNPCTQETCQCTTIQPGRIVVYCAGTANTFADTSKLLKAYKRIVIHKLYV